jgi:hypothetical protein
LLFSFLMRLSSSSSERCSTTKQFTSSTEYEIIV